MSVDPGVARANPLLNKVPAVTAAACTRPANTVLE
jgi:hypothetical protein